MSYIAERQSTLRSGWRLRVKELGAFGVVGGISFLLDVGLFQLLYAHLDIEAAVSKLLATAVAMSAAFAGHRYWSFAHRARTGLRREYVRFTVINGATLLLGVLTIVVVRHPLHQESALVLQLANIGAIVVGTVIRYVCYRAWVFPAHADPVEPARAAVDPMAPAP